jgi:hypothetical protein
MRCAATGESIPPESSATDGFLDCRADRLVDFHRVEPKPLVGAGRAHAKAVGTPMRTRNRDRLARDPFDIAPDRAAKRKILQPEDQRGALGGDLVIDFIGQLDDQAWAFAAHRAELEVGEYGAQVALHPVNEAPLVASLECDFVVSSNQVTHRDRSIPQGFPDGRVILLRRVRTGT